MTEPSGGWPRDREMRGVPQPPQIVGGILLGGSFWLARRHALAQGLGFFASMRHAAAQGSAAGVGLGLLDYLPRFRPDAERGRVLESPMPPAFYALLPIVAFPQLSATLLQSAANLVRNPVRGWSPFQVFPAHETLRFYQRLGINPQSLWAPLFAGLRNMPSGRDVPRILSAGFTRASIAAPLSVELYRAISSDRSPDTSQLGFGARYLLELAGSMLVGAGMLGSVENAISQRSFAARFQRGLPFLYTSLYGGLLLDRHNLFYFDTSRPNLGLGYGDQALETRGRPSASVEALRLTSVWVVSAALMRNIFEIYSNPLRSPRGAVPRLNELFRLAVLGPLAANVASPGRIRGHIEFDPLTFGVSARLQRGNAESLEGDSAPRNFVRAFVSPSFEVAGILRMMRATSLRAGWRGALFYTGGQLLDTLSDVRVSRYRIEFSDPPGSSTRQ